MYQDNFKTSGKQVLHLPSHPDTHVGDNTPRSGVKDTPIKFLNYIKSKLT